MRTGIGLSLLFHILLVVYVSLRQAGTLGVEPKQPNLGKPLAVRTLTQAQMEHELAQALDAGKSQVVQGDDSLISKEAGQRKGEILLSKHNQKVDVETKAARIGKYKNVLREGAQESRPSSAHAAAAKHAAPESAPSEVSKLFLLMRNDKDREPESAQTRNTGRLRAPASVDVTGVKAGEGSSANDDYLKDVATGVNTLLNTREYKFYGFYERIREKLSYHWHQNLEEAFNKIVAAHNNIIGREEVTQVQVKLKADGQLDSVRVVGTSGFVELDHAATEAFRRAAPFPNPPKEMMDDAHVVQLRWDFVVVADENAGMQMQVRQSSW